MNVTDVQLRDPTNIHHAAEYKAAMPIYVAAISDAKLNKRGQQERDKIFQDETLYHIQFTHPMPQQGKRYSPSDIQTIIDVAQQFKNEPTQGPLCVALLALAIERGRTFAGIYDKAVTLGLV